MKYFTRRQLIEMLRVEETFLIALEEEEIVSCDAPEEAGSYSDLMLERVRVADNLVNELEVNIPGVAVILKLREELSHLRLQLEEIARELKRRKRG